MPRFILSLGCDATLLESRKLLLESAGFAVISETSIKAAIHRCHQAALDPAHAYFDLVLFCHTLERSDVDTVCQELRQFLPGAHRLWLRTIDDVSYNPASFLDRIDQAVSGDIHLHDAA
jgi:CheY-like chemotaxis protein